MCGGDQPLYVADRDILRAASSVYRDDLDAAELPRPPEPPESLLCSGGGRLEDFESQDKAFEEEFRQALLARDYARILSVVSRVKAMRLRTA